MYSVLRLSYEEIENMNRAVTNKEIESNEQNQESPKSPKKEKPGTRWFYWWIPLKRKDHSGAFYEVGIILFSKPGNDTVEKKVTDQYH